jgi:hypothetical protein
LQKGEGDGKKGGVDFDQQINHFPETVDRLMNCISKVYFDYEQFEKFLLTTRGGTPQSKEAMKKLLKEEKVWAYSSISTFFCRRYHAHSNTYQYKYKIKIVRSVLFILNFRTRWTREIRLNMAPTLKDSRDTNPMPTMTDRDTTKYCYT